MWLLSHNISLVLLILVVLTVSLWPRISPAARHALWLLVLIKMLTPPFVAWPWSVPILPRFFTETAQPIAESPPVPDFRREEGPQQHMESPPLMLRTIEPSDNSLSQLANEQTSAGQMQSQPSSEWGERTIDAAALVWMGGGLIVAVVQVRRLMRLRHWLLHARAAPLWLTSQVQELAGTFGVRPPRLAVLPGLRSPLVWAGGSTSLLWPEELENELSPRGCRAVLAHELAHLARRDHWVAWLIFVAGCLWWWNPLFYLIRRRLHREAELACDARVIAVLPDSRRCYAEALLDVCQRQSKATALAPALGVVGRRRDLERRLVMIMRANVSSRLSLRLLVGIGLLGLMVLPGWTLGQVKKPSKNAAADQDKQLQELERKLQSIQKDLESLRKTAPAVAVDFGFPVVDPQAVKLKTAVFPNALELKTAVFPNLALPVAGPQASPQVSIFQSMAAPVSDQKSDRDKKLQEIEAKVQALLKEVQALRGSKTASEGQVNFIADVTTGRVIDWVVEIEKSQKPVEITLSRTTYKLPTAKAEALGKLLQQHVKAKVMEIKVEGDSLTVTTTPEVQQGIRQFIAVMEGKPQPIHLWKP